MRLLVIALLLLTPALAHAGVAAVDGATCPCCAPSESPLCCLAVQEDGDPCGPSCTCFEPQVHWLTWERSRSSGEPTVGRLSETRRLALVVDSRNAAGGAHGTAVVVPRRLADFLGVLLI